MKNDTKTNIKYCWWAVQCNGVLPMDHFLDSDVVQDKENIRQIYLGIDKDNKYDFYPDTYKDKYNFI